ncbi:MAG: pyridoxal 5'-phosphate synthase glutaminase subunit PdxT [Candidatus Coproplasma sp.]
MRIGVLALQGAFIEHEKMLAKVGADSFEIRKLCDLDKSFDALIIPGGESTVQGKLLNELGMTDKMRRLIEGGMPVWGTCAGLILLAKRIDGGEKPHLATMDITAKRNAYGRQLGSFFCVSDFKGLGQVPMTFIRAPYIESFGEGVEELSSVNGRTVAARQKNMLVTAFHPELTDSLAIHEYFLKEFVK